MRFLRYLFFVGALAPLVPLHADLVWREGEGWSVEGGVLAPFFGEGIQVENALQAMNAARDNQAKGNYWTAISLYERIIEDYPDSIFAPEAHFQLGNIYIARHQWEKAFDTFNDIITRYPDYPKFNEVIGKQYEIAALIQEGKRPYLWGVIPWFRNYNDGIRFYEGVVRNAPYSEYAPLALMNIALLARDINKPEESIDALDRLINNYPQSMLAPDGYFNLAETYASMVQGAYYDQAATREAINFYQDFLILYPEMPEVPRAEANLLQMRDTLARSKFLLGEFYYLYRNNPRASQILLGEAITVAPESPAADEARALIAKIRAGVPPPRTPVDWIFGRYREPSMEEYLDETQIENLQNEAFQLQQTEMLIDTPGMETVETIGTDGDVSTYQGLAAPIEPVLDQPGMVDDDGFIVDPKDDPLLTPVEQIPGAGPAPGEEPGGRPLLD
jgi:outer membrane protein assembly factor BamD